MKLSWNLRSVPVADAGFANKGTPIEDKLLNLLEYESLTIIEFKLFYIATFLLNGPFLLSYKVYVDINVNFQLGA